MLSALTMLLAVAASSQIHTRLLVEDPALLTSSAGTGTLLATLGNQLNYALQAQPQGLGYVAFSPTPPSGPDTINGIPVEIDLANFAWVLEAAPFDSQGELTWSTFLPENLNPGTSLWTQAAALDPITGLLHLSNGVRLDIVPPDPGNLPLLPAGQHVGVTYTPPLPAAQAPLDLAFLESLAHRADAATLHTAWNDIELSPGKYTTANLEAELQQNAALGLRTLVVLETINGELLEVPSDLVDPQAPDQLAPGLAWDSPAIAARFATMLDLIAPLVVAYDGYFLSVGHEVDRYLAVHPSDLGSFVNFTDAARTHVHGTLPKLSVGVTLTANEALSGGPNLPALLTASDNLAFTYFPLKADHSAADPLTPLSDVPLLAALVAPHPLVLQAVGYGSGATPVPLAGGSPTKQATFTRSLFEALSLVPKARATIFGRLSDLTGPELTELRFVTGSGDANFIENRRTTGMRLATDGSAKPSWSEFLLGLDSL